MTHLLFTLLLLAPAPLQTVAEIAEHAKTQPLSAAHLDRLEMLLETDPANREAFDLLVHHYYGLQNWGALIRLYSQWPNPNAGDKLTLGKLLVRDGRFTQAAAMLQPMADAQPQQEELNRLAGHALFYSRNPETATPYLERVIDAAVAVKRPDPLYMRGMIHFYAGDYPAAVNAFQKVLTFAPGHVPTLNSLGRTLSAAGERDKAVPILQRAAQLQAAQTAAEKQQLRMGSALRHLEQAWRAKDYATCEALIQKLLPQADATLKPRLTAMLNAVYQATGRQGAAQ